MKTINLNENVHLHILQTTKFKDVNIYVDLLDNSDKEDQTERLLLAHMLEDTCTLYDTKELVSNHMAKLYDARLSVFPDVKGKARILEVKSSVINGKFVSEDNLLEKQFKDIYEFLLNPLWINKSYPLKLFNEIKDRLRLFINSESDNPNAYSYKKADILFGEYLKVKANYTVERLDDIDVTDVIDLYNKLINENVVDIFVVGDVVEEEVIKLSTKYLNFKGRKANKELVYKAKLKEYVEKVEERKINQSLLQLRYTIERTSLDNNFHAMLIANGILGTLPTSLLFQEIREKRSLCYMISSTVNGYDGTLKIFTGSDRKNLNEVRDLIKIQVERIKNGDFDDELLETTKKMYINIYRQGKDNIKSLMWDEYRNTLINDDLTLEKSIEKIKHVTKESIMDVFKDVELKVCFILKQSEENYDE